MDVSIVGLVSSYGYLVVFLVVGLESVGIPLPGETALITAAAFAAQGHLAIAGVVLAAIAGAILGDSGGYWIGRVGGIAIVQRYGHVLHLDERKLDRVHAFFATHGAKTVFIGRFIALLRTWAAFFAGAGRMPYGEFLIYNAVGGVTWAALFGTLGYVFGRNLPTLERYVGQASLALVLLVALVAILVVLWRRFPASRAALWDAGERAWGACCGSGVARRLHSRYPRAWRFVVARFTPGQFLGLHLSVGLIVSLGALGLFGGVVEDVLHHEPLTRFDQTLLATIRAHATLTGDRVFAVISLAGSPVVMAALAVGGVAWLAWRRRWLLLCGWGAAFGGAGVLAWALKLVIRRPRPAGAAAFLHSATFSFPSGHALGSLVGYGMLAYVLACAWPDRRGTRLAITTTAALLIVAIGVSRLYLGVHYFSDVVGGYAAGVCWLSVCISGLDIAQQRQALQAPDHVHSQ